MTGFVIVVPTEEDVQTLERALACYWANDVSQASHVVYAERMRSLARCEAAVDRAERSY